MDTTFFILSKLLTPLLLLETWIALALIIGLGLLRVGRTRPARTLLTGGVAMFLVAGTFPLGLLLLNAIEARHPPNPAVAEVAGIILLGGGEEPLRSAVWDQPLVNEGGDRYIAGLMLAERHPTALVVFTGGIGSLDQSGPSEADIAARILIGAGLAPDRLRVDGTARNTAENAARALPLRDPRPGAWLLVTSAAHMPRAVESFCAAGWTDLVPWPTDYRSGQSWSTIGWNVPGNLAALASAVRETVGLFVYRATGRASTDPACFYDEARDGQGG
jgi:uncharacterized SAM-binding protein YcdF (DUF218 family)